MNTIIGSTTSETNMIKAIQRAVGAAEDGMIGGETMAAVAADWWLRSPLAHYTDRVWNVRSNGDCNRWNAGNSYGVRPALILPSDFVI